MLKKSFIAISVLVVGVLLTTASIAEAQSPPIGDINQLYQKAKSEAQARQANRSQVPAVDNALTGTQLSLCNERIGDISTITQSMNNRREDMYKQITAIFSATELYQAEKKLDVMSYDNLLSDARSSQAVAMNAKDIQKSVSTFSCTMDKPRTALATFLDKRASSVDAIKNYKDDVKKFVDAVNSAAKSAEVLQ